MSSTLTAALDYAANGWPVLPLHSIQDGKCSCGKTCRSPGKHPHTRNGLKDASHNKSTIEQWWSKWPGANVGILTGHASGLLVLDVDPRNGGNETLSAIISEYGRLPETLEARTGGNGQHILFAYPDTCIKGGNNKLGDGLDVKSDGGYIVASPSNHISGGTYEWLSTTSPAIVPCWLLDLLDSENDSVPNSGVIREGSRNNTLASMGGRFRSQGKSKSAIEAELLMANENLCSPPLDSGEVLRIADSVCRYSQGKTKPKHIWLDLVRSDDGPKDPAVRHVLKDLVSFMNGDDSTCYPTHETLSRTTGIHQKTIGKHLRSACKDGWINVIGHKGEGQQWRNNVYSLSLPPKMATKHSQLLARFWTSALKVGMIHAKGGSNTFPYTSSNTNHIGVVKLQRVKERGKDY